jgi:hypothetical protein
MPRPDIVLGRISRIARERRDLEERLARKDAELIEACRAARETKTLEEIGVAAGYTKQWAGKVTGRADR